MSFLSIALVLAWSALHAQAPDTEVFLARLAMDGGKLTVSAPVNISNSPGYDNQPSFTPDGGAVFFTSARGGPPQGATGTAQMDIYRFDIASKAVSQVTNTPESEYSAVVTPDGKHISVIRVEADKTQRLWKFPLAGGAPSLVLADVKPVGYHAWLDANTVAMFVLGEPATLQVARRAHRQDRSRREGHRPLAAAGTGRGRQLRAACRARDGTHDDRVDPHSASRRARAEDIDADGAGRDRGVRGLDAGRHAADGGGGHLHAWRRGDNQWQPVADLAAIGLRNVSRLAVSPKGDWLALVAAR